MRRLIILPILFIMMASCVLGAEMTRVMPSRIEPGNTLTVTFEIKNMELQKVVGISEVIPPEFRITNWNVEGAAESRDEINHAVEGNNYKWEFTAVSSTPKLTYELEIPADVKEADYEFDAVYILPPANMNNLRQLLKVRTIRCGDGLCEGNENPDSCEIDCPRKVEPRPSDTKPADEVVQQKGDRSWIWWLIVVAVLVGIIFMLLMKKPPKQEESPLKEEAGAEETGSVSVKRKRRKSPEDNLPEV